MKRRYRYLERRPCEAGLHQGYGTTVPGRFDVTRICDGNDAAYLDWLHRNPEGYVINTRREPDPGYMVLHRARCKTIQNYHSSMTPGAFTERSYIKVCSDRLDELRDWVRTRGRLDGSFSKECSLCDRPRK